MTDPKGSYLPMLWGIGFVLAFTTAVTINFIWDIGSGVPAGTAITLQAAR